MSNIVTYEQAKRLKEIGYNGIVRNYYEPEIYDNVFSGLPSDYNTLLRYEGKRVSAPTVSEALDYLREEKRVACCVRLSWYEENKYYPEYAKGGFMISDRKNLFDTHPIASSALLTAVLDYLEKKGGEG